MIGRLAAIPLMLVSLAASAEDGQITLKNLLGDDPETLTSGPPPIGWTYMSGVDNPMIATLGVGGCIVGPFKLFNHGQTILEIPLGVEYPVGCRGRK